MKHFKKIGILVVGILIIVLLLSGCEVNLKVPYLHPIIFDLCHWSSSNSSFVSCINNLKTPEQICQYMEDHFTYKSPVVFGKSPYDMWKNTYGDCRDYSCFGSYVAQKHGYTAYDMYMNLSVGSHINGIYKEGSSYSYSNCYGYRSGFSSFQAIVNDYCKRQGTTCGTWVVYDDCRKITSSKGITAKTKFINPGSDECMTFIGEEPKNRSSWIAGGRTIINKGNPARYSGTIENIGIRSYSTLYNVQIATFYKTGTDCFSTRDYQTIGTVYGGSAREYLVNLYVRAGDYIGMYFTGSSQAMERDLSGYAGIWHQNLDNIPCTNRHFDLISGDAISLGGIVITW